MGAELALERMGLDADIVWYCEIEPAACRVLAKHLPNVPNLGDITKVDWSQVPHVDAITAGYPCQPFSIAGNRTGTDDPRHIWPSVFSAVCMVRPTYVYLENVAVHLSVGFDIVLADLASVGFDAEWTTFRASDVGACHKRDRLFVVATHPLRR